VESTGWTLSGLQKTTSLEFEGRWEGESTRSAYLFFHRSDLDEVSIDAYLDETGRGLTGNLALVVDLAPLARVGDPNGALRDLGSLSAAEMPAGYSTPLTLRLRLPDGATEPAEAEVEVRFKLTLPGRVISAGGDEIRGLVGNTVTAFERILASAELSRYRIAG
jgi:hypothetical protein